MRLLSNRGSAEAEDVSALACLETVVASAILFIVYLPKEHAWQIVVAVCLSPFLLLRTDRSSNIALQITHRIVRYTHLTLDNSELPMLRAKHDPSCNLSRLRLFLYKSRYTLLYGFCIFEVPIVALFSKLYSTTRCLIESPAETISEIPSNWRRVVLCTDIGAAPEIIPHIEDISVSDRSGLYLYTLGHLKSFVTRKYSGIAPIAHRFEMALMILAYMTVGLSALVYRFSVKCTALVWFPFQWIRKPITDPSAIKPALLKVLKLKISDIGRTVSLITIVLFAVKLVIFYCAIELKSRYAESHEIERIIDVFIVPDRIPIWHLAAVINALLTWYLFFVCDRYAKEFEFSQNVG